MFSLGGSAGSWDNDIASPAIISWDKKAAQRSYSSPLTVGNSAVEDDSQARELVSEAHCVS